MPEDDWCKLLDLIGLRKPKFESLLPQATRALDDFFLYKSGTQSFLISTFPLKPTAIDGQNGVFHRQPPESGVPSRCSIGQAPGQITRESIPAPAVPSADLIPPSFTRPTSKRGIPSPLALKMALIPIRTTPSSIEVGDGDSSGLRTTAVTTILAPTIAQMSSTNCSIPSAASNDESLNSALLRGDADRTLLDPPDWDKWFGN